MGRAVCQALAAPRGLAQIEDTMERLLTYLETKVFPGGCFFNSRRENRPRKATIAWRVKRHTIHVRRRLDDAVSANLCHVVLDVSVARSGLSAE